MPVKPKANRVKEELKINEDQWQCITCTLVNEIDWDSQTSTQCTACEKPNILVDEMITEKRIIRQEQLEEL